MAHKREASDDPKTGKRKTVRIPLAMNFSFLSFYSLSFLSDGYVLLVRVRILLPPLESGVNDEEYLAELNKKERRKNRRDEGEADS